MNFTKYNKNQFEKIEWSKDTKGFAFKKLGDFYGEGVKKVRVFGFFFTKSEQYGLQPIAICEDCLLNLPTHKKDVISEMLKDKETVEAIDKGDCTLEIREYQSKYNKTCYDVNFTDTEKIAKQNNETQPPIF